MIKTFRGLLADNTMDRIRLQTIKGKVGYRIVKFQVLGPDANSNLELVIKIYKTEQTANTTDINFTESELLAAAVYNDKNDVHYQPSPIIIFDTEIFNQDIFVTNRGHDSPGAINYYIELEVIPLDDAGAEYTTLKDMRQS
jgi:hypothetical protein